ncbi:hypothetical protein ABZP36_004958 [Zizania latifolia]
MLVLFETPAGFALFKVLDEGKLDKVEDLWKEFTTSDSARKVVELKAFNKFENTSDALSAATLIIDSKPSKGLRKFLQKHCEGETLAVADSKLGNAIKEKLKINCLHNSAVMELMRGLRNQLTELISGLGAQDLGPMSLGLSHSLSRYKLKFSPEKVDTMIVQAIGLLDDLDKELNTYAMRVREWYGWHFPELTKIVTDNIQYAKVAKMMGNRTNAVNLDFSEILSDDEVEAQLKEAAVISMGTEVSELDLLNIRELCDQVLSLSEYRAQLFDYLRSRMNTIAPNLTTLVGELVGARLIAHGGSLVNLAKQPGSTIQILGAEKALFRALKTKHATPKYGLIYHASLIGQAAPKHKGKISRSLAAKTALAIRYDALGDGEDNSIGLESRIKLETRLRVLEGKELGRSAGSTMGKPKIEVYEKDRKKGAGALITPSKTYNPATDLVLGQCTETPKKREGASKKRKHDEAEPVPAAEPAEETVQEDGEQEEGKKKKKKTSKESLESPVADADCGKKKKKKKKSKESEEPPVATAEGEKKKKKKSDLQDTEDVAIETKRSGLQFDEAQWIIRIRRVLDEDAELDDSQPISIFDVPKPLLCSKPEAYIPQLVAIGPYHHRREELRDMEMYKLCAAKRAQSHLPDKNLQQLVDIFAALEYRIRAHYHRHLSLGNETLAWMMAIDVSFLLEFLQTFSRNNQQRTLQRIPSRMSHLVDPSRRTSSQSMVLHDIVKLENQIPLFLLVKAMETRSWSSRAARPVLNLSSMLTGFFHEVSTFEGMASPCTDDVTRHVHLLDFLYTNMVPCYVEGSDDTTEQAEHESHDVKRALLPVTDLLIRCGVKFLSIATDFIVRIVSRFVSTVPCLSVIARPIEQLTSHQTQQGSQRKDASSPAQSKNVSPLLDEIAVPSVAELVYSGVKFVPANGGLEAIEFCAKAATLHLPVIRVDGMSETVLRNLVAYEAASVGCSTLVLARYVELMNGIIDTDEDARLLRESGVILSHLKNDQEVAELWNGMTRSVRLTRVAALDRVIDGLNRHHSSCWKVRVRTFLKEQQVLGSREMVTCVTMVLLVLFLSLQVFCVARGGGSIPASHGMARTTTGAA